MCAVHVCGVWRVANLVEAIEAFSNKNLLHAVEDAGVDDPVGAEGRHAAGLGLEAAEHNVDRHGEGDDDGGLDDVIDGERQRVLEVVEHTLARLDLHDQCRQLVAVREESHHIVEDTERDERAQAAQKRKEKN